MAPIFLKVTTCRDDFGIDQPCILLPLHLAEVGGFPVAQEGFKQGVLLGAANVHLDVAATGCPASMVGGSAWCCGARIRVRSHRKRMAARGWRGEVAVNDLTILDDPEVVVSEPSGLHLSSRNGNDSRVAVCSAGTGSGGVVAEVAARNVDRHLTPQLVVILEGPAELESFCVPEEPGGVVIFLALDRGHAGDNLEAATLGAKGAAGGRGHRDPG